MSGAIRITGRPGSGRTTLAAHVAEAVQAWPVTLKVLDLADARRALVRRGWAAPDIALDYEESLHPELRRHTHAPDFRSTVEDVLLLARRLHRAAALPVTQAGRNVP